MTFSGGIAAINAAFVGLALWALLRVPPGSPLWWLLAGAITLNALSAGLWIGNMVRGE